MQKQKGILSLKVKNEVGIISEAINDLINYGVWPRSINLNDKNGEGMLYIGVDDIKKGIKVIEYMSGEKIDTHEPGTIIMGRPDNSFGIKLDRMFQTGEVLSVLRDANINISDINLNPNDSNRIILYINTNDNETAKEALRLSNDPKIAQYSPDLLGYDYVRSDWMGHEN